MAVIADTGFILGLWSTLAAYIPSHISLCLFCVCMSRHVCHLRASRLSLVAPNYSAVHPVAGICGFVHESEPTL